MRKFLLLLAFLFMISCGGEGFQRIIPVTGGDGGHNDDKHQEVSEEKPDGENQVVDEESLEKTDGYDDSRDDSDISGDYEVSDNGESGEPAADSDSAENDDVPEEPDGEPLSDNDVQEESDEEPPVCGELFSGSNCFRASCETDADCCEADLCVAADACGGAKVCRNAFFKENFDSYIAGSFPNANWTLKYGGWGSQYQIVTSEKYVLAENSMHLLGSRSYNNSAIMTSVLPEVPDVINVEMKMNTQGDNVSFSLCTFEKEKPNQNWGNYDMKVEFADGKIRYQIPEWSVYVIAPSYEPNEWYKIRLKLDQVNKTVSVWVNDELKVDNQVHNFDSLSIPNICLVSDKNDKKVWFDDIFVWAE